VLHLSTDLTIQAVQHEKVDFVSFTGSVVGGRDIQEAASVAKGFKGVALEVSLCVFIMGCLINCVA
jgi:acyl-CoA reductase-like NAD-dependent aldehyde dehydrogenase